MSTIPSVDSNTMRHLSSAQPLRKKIFSSARTMAKNSRKLLQCRAAVLQENLISHCCNNHHPTRNLDNITSHHTAVERAIKYKLQAHHTTYDILQLENQHDEALHGSLLSSRRDLICGGSHMQIRRYSLWIILCQVRWYYGMRRRSLHSKQ